MKIHLIKTRATEKQITDMSEALGDYVKLAVDVKRGVLAGGGILHADCEVILLEDGSCQEDIWGANWSPSTNEVQHTALINIRPGQNNPSMEILDGAIRAKVAEITRNLLEKP